MQEWDTPVTAMFYHFLVPEGGHPTWEENCFEKKYQNTRSFLYATPVNLKSVANIFPYIKYDFLSHMFIIDQSWNTLQHKYCAEFPPTLWANHYPFYNQ